MQRADFAEFRELLNRAAEVYGKPKPSDALIEAYWSSLLDVHFAIVKRCAEAHLKHGKFFPKPAELRPKEDKPATIRDPATDAAFRDGEQRAIRNLEEQRRRDPELWRKEVAMGHLDRLMATLEPGSAAYEVARIQWLDARGLHVGVSERAAVARLTREAS